jgi:hypothetical protein
VACRCVRLAVSPLSMSRLSSKCRSKSQSQRHITTTVSRLVRLGVRRPSVTRDQFFFLLEIFFRQFHVCYFVAPSLTRGRVCNLLLLLVLASSVPLGSALSDKRSGLSCVSLLSISVYRQSVRTQGIYIRYLHYLCLTQLRDVYTMYTWPLSVQARYSRLCPSYW